MTYHPVGALAELWSGDLVAVAVSGTRLVLARIDDSVYAFADRCAHLGLALSAGSLDGRVLTCAAHHWQYDVVTGCGVNPATACLQRFPLKIEHGTIYVELERAQ